MLYPFRVCSVFRGSGLFRVHDCCRFRVVREDVGSRGCALRSCSISHLVLRECGRSGSTRAVETSREWRTTSHRVKGQGGPPHADFVHVLDNCYIDCCCRLEHTNDSSYSLTTSVWDAASKISVQTQKAEESVPDWRLQHEETKTSPATNKVL